MRLLEVDVVYAMLYSRAQLNFYSYVLLFSDLDKHGVRDLGIRCVACKSFVNDGALVTFTVPVLVWQT